MFDYGFAPCVARTGSAFTLVHFHVRDKSIENVLKATDLGAYGHLTL